MLFNFVVYLCHWLDNNKSESFYQIKKGNLAQTTWIGVYVRMFMYNKWDMRQKFKYEKLKEKQKITSEISL